MKPDLCASKVLPFVVVAVSVAACRDPLTPEGPGAITAAAVSGVTNLTALAVSESRIDLTWSDGSSHETGFEVHRSFTGFAGPFFYWATRAADVTTFSDVGLTPVTNYCYRVRSVRAVRAKITYGAFSPVACATTPLPPPPSTPTAVAAKAANSSSIEVGWTSTAPYVSEFRVERSVDFGSTWSLAFVTSAIERLVTDQGRSNEQEVCYRVEAVYLTLTSDPSSPACTSPPAAPSDISGFVTWEGDCCVSLSLTWTDNSNVEDGYEIWTWFWDASGPVPILEAHLPANSTDYFTPYYSGWAYLVYAVKDGGRSDPAIY
jgi:hypothetical protein